MQINTFFVTPTPKVWFSTAVEALESDLFHPPDGKVEITTSAGCISLHYLFYECRSVTKNYVWLARESSFSLGRMWPSPVACTAYIAHD